MAVLCFFTCTSWNPGESSRGRVQRGPKELFVLWSILQGSPSPQGEWVLPLLTAGVRAEREGRSPWILIFSRKAAPLWLRTRRCTDGWRCGVRERCPPQPRLSSSPGTWHRPRWKRGTRLEEPLLCACKAAPVCREVFLVYGERANEKPDPEWFSSALLLVRDLIPEISIPLQSWALKSWTHLRKVIQHPLGAKACPSALPASPPAPQHPPAVWLPRGLYSRAPRGGSPLCHLSLNPASLCLICPKQQFPPLSAQAPPAGQQLPSLSPAWAGTSGAAQL